MPASYPAGYDTMSDPSANLSGPPLHSTMHNQINDVVEAIEAELGLNPSGADTTVAALLTRMPQGIIGPITTATGGGSTSGTTATGLLVGGSFTAVVNRYYVATAAFDWIGSTIGDVFAVEIRDGSAAGTILGGIAAGVRITTKTTAAQDLFFLRTRPFTLSAASHAPWIVATRLSGTGTLTLVAGEQSLYVEDIGHT